MLAAHDAAGSFGDLPVRAPSADVKRLAPGSRLGAFTIETLLGAGGMGEVYRAHDTRLGRAVAIKVLPDSVAHDADRRARFEHEARALAALNHPHIGSIYGVEESGDVAGLVLELVEGPTLAERMGITNAGFGVEARDAGRAGVSGWPRHRVRCAGQAGHGSVRGSAAGHARADCCRSGYLELAAVER